MVHLTMEGRRSGKNVKLAFPPKNRLNIGRNLVSTRGMDKLDVIHKTRSIHLIDLLSDNIDVSLNIN